MAEALAVREVGLLRVEEARNMLAECRRVDEVRDIRDKASAIQAYLRQQNASKEAQNDAAEIKLRAERRLGELLAETNVKGGTRHKSAEGICERLPTLPDGVTANQSSKWQAVASVPEEAFEAHLATVRRNNERITTAALIEDVRRAEKLEEIAKVRTPALATIPDCPVVLADPPWRYEHSKTDNRQIENQYPTMELAEICALRAPAATPSVLFLWATSPKLEEAMLVLRQWGFEYRSCAVWVKDKIGMGYWFRQQHELLLVGVRGDMPPPPPELRASSVIQAERGEHSAKPEEVHALIERAYPTLPKVEMFARKPRDGWHVWGNQA